MLKRYGLLAIVGVLLAVAVVGIVAIACLVSREMKVEIAETATNDAYNGTM